MPRRKSIDERKTERFNFAMRLNQKEGLAKLAWIDRCSLASAMGNAIDYYIASRADDIKRYENFFGDSNAPSIEGSEDSADE